MKGALTWLKRRPPASGRASTGETVWTDEEQAAMQESAKERKAASRQGQVDERAEAERGCGAKIAEMPGNRSGFHALVMERAPVSSPRT